MSVNNYNPWSSKELAEKYLGSVRGAIPLEQEQIETMLRVINGCNMNIDRILDLGCGDGILAESILQQHSNASVVLVDISEPMLHAASQRFANYKIKTEIILLDYSDSRWINKVQGPFNIIVSGFSIHHQANKRKQDLYSKIFDR